MCSGWSRRCHRLDAAGLVGDVLGALDDVFGHQAVAKGHDAGGIGDKAHLVGIDRRGVGVGHGQKGGVDVAVGPAHVAAFLDLVPGPRFEGDPLFHAEGADVLVADRLQRAAVGQLLEVEAAEEAADIAAPGGVDVKPEGPVQLPFPFLAQEVDRVDRIDCTLFGGADDADDGGDVFVLLQLVEHTAQLGHVQLEARGHRHAAHRRLAVAKDVGRLDDRVVRRGRDKDDRLQADAVEHGRQPALADVVVAGGDVFVDLR